MSLEPGARRRLNPQFEPTGRQAASLADDGRGLAVESWDLTGERPRRTRIGVGGQQPGAQPVPTGDGRVLLAVNGRRPAVLLAGDDGPPLLEAVGCLGVRLLASPDPATLAVVVGTLATGGTRIWRIADHRASRPAGGTSPWFVPPDGDDRRVDVRPVVELTGAASGGFWMDATGRRLALLHRGPDGVTNQAVDLTTGQVDAVDGIDPAHRLLLVAPDAGRALVAVPGPDGPTLAVTTLDGAGPVRPATALRRLPGALHPLAWSPDGGELALRLNRGPRSRLVRYDPRDDSVRESALPAGTLGGTASWSSGGLHLAYTAPTVPTTIATVAVPGGLRLPSDAVDPSAVDARCEWLDGPDGPVEALVYGGERWRDRPHLVLALHGGPEAAWQLAHDPLLHRIAGTGAAVVALNQRGSTGYGATYRRAIVGAWGGPDLADLRRCAEDLVAYRSRRGLPPPALYGTSYGGFLALLAIGTAPELFSRAAVVAPFLSGPRLRAEASEPVRAMLDRLGGCVGADAPDGTRDAAVLCARGAQREALPPLLVLHGAADATVPVTQSRELVRVLRAAGRRDGVDFVYRELPDAGHQLADGVYAPEVARALAGFLAGGPLPAVPAEVSPSTASEATPGARVAERPAPTVDAPP